MLVVATFVEEFKGIPTPTPTPARPSTAQRRRPGSAQRARAHRAEHELVEAFAVGKRAAGPSTRSASSASDCCPGPATTTRSAANCCWESVSEEVWLAATVPDITGTTDSTIVTSSSVLDLIQLKLVIGEGNFETAKNRMDMGGRRRGWVDDGSRLQPASSITQRSIFKQRITETLPIQQSRKSLDRVWLFRSIRT